MKHTLTILLLAPFILALGCMDSPTTGKTRAAKSKETHREGKVEFLEFHADWCGPCRQQKPIVQALQAKYKDVNFRVIDIDDDDNLALVRRHKVSSIPRIVILIDGEVEEDYLGLRSADELTRGLDKAISLANRRKAP